jgi:hypothetical protein
MAGAMGSSKQCEKPAVVMLGVIAIIVLRNASSKETGWRLGTRTELLRLRRENPEQEGELVQLRTEIEQMRISWSQSRSRPKAAML